MPEPYYRIPLAVNLQGGNPVQQPVDHRLVYGVPASVTIDLNQVRFARPSGLAFLYVLVYSLVDIGHTVTLTQPETSTSEPTFGVRISGQSFHTTGSTYPQHGMASISAKPPA